MTKEKIKRFEGPAGGWQSLKASADHMLGAGNPATIARTLLKANQPDGFDCPGCAWGDPATTSTLEFCENGVKAIAWEATKKRVTPDFFAAHPVSWLAAQDSHYLESLGRLTHPMVYRRPTNHYEPISWDDAFAFIGRELNALASPDEAAFYTSGRTSNEAAFLWQLFVREFGTNNLPDCSNMCHEASGVALMESIGIGKGTVLLEDIAKADAIFLFGQNPGTNHPRMLTDLRQAAQRGAKIVTVNPLKERGLERFAHPKSPLDMLTNKGVPLTHLYLQPQVDGDLAFVKGMMKLIVEADDRAVAEGSTRVIDVAFIHAHTRGFAEFAEDLRQQPWQPILDQSGLSRDEIEAAARIYMHAERVICTWAMGITQHIRSVETIQNIANLLLLRGNIGRPGTGPCPVRGHSNVQGDRTMGITELPTEAFLDALERVFQFRPPRHPGVNTVETVRAMAEGRIKALLAMGGNFAAACPDHDLTWSALRNCRLTVHVSTKLNRSHVICGNTALILPTLGRTEIDMQKSGKQKITVEDSMSMVHASSGLNDPASPNLRSEPAIIAGIARATLPQSKMPWGAFRDDYSLIRDKIEEVFSTFEDFNDKIGRAGGFYLGNSAKERRWNTDTGKANFMVAPLPRQSIREAAQSRLKDKVFTLMTFRSHDQYNTTIYGHRDRYRGIHGTRKVVFINQADLEELALKNGDVVDLKTVSEDQRERVARSFKLVPYDIPRGCLGAYYPETNVLVPLYAHGPRSGTPASKSTPVTIRPATNA